MNAMVEQINSVGNGFVEFAAPMLAQSGALILILLLADLVLRKRVRAVFRYWIWLLVLAKLVLPTSLSSPVSLGYWFGDELRSVKITKPTTAVTGQAAPQTTEPAPIDLGNVGPAVVRPPAENIGPALPIEAAAEPTVPATPVTPVTLQGVVFLVWLAVAAAMGLLLLQRVVFVGRLVAEAKEANDSLKNALEFCQGQIGVKRKVGLKVSAKAASPAACGIWRPVILLPRNLVRNLAAGDLRAVLLHELAHIKRGDLWVNLIQTLLQIVYFYNPLLWLANAIIRRVREQAVDEMVLAAMGEKAQRYPQTLVNVAKLAFGRPALSLRLIGVVESKSALTSRIKRILNRPIPKSAKLGALGLVAVIAVAAILLPMAGSKPKLAKGDESNLRARLANGVTVELVGICEHPSEGARWWRPDGSALEKAPYFRTEARLEVGENEKLREIAIRFRGRNVESAKKLFCLITGEKQREGLRMVKRRVKGGRKKPDIWAITSVLGETQETITAPIGVAAGPWETRAVSDGKEEVSFDIAQGQATFRKAHDEGRWTYQTVKVKGILFDTEGRGGFEGRIVAIDDAGSLLAGERTSGAWRGDTGFYTYVFSLPLKKIVEFVYQTRPYNWVEFGDVSLEPGLMTDVEVEVKKGEVDTKIDAVSRNWPHPNPTEPPTDTRFKDFAPEELLGYILDRKSDDCRLACAWFIWKTRDSEEGEKLRGALADQIVERIHQNHEDPTTSPDDCYVWVSFLGPLGAREQTLALLQEAERFDCCCCCYGPALVESLGMCGTMEDVPVLIDAIDKESEVARGVVNEALYELTGVQMLLDDRGYTDKAAWQEWWKSREPTEKPAEPSAGKTSVEIEVEGVESGSEIWRQVERMKLDDPAERTDAVKKLGQMGEKAIPAIPFLIEALTDRGAIDGPNGRTFRAPKSGSLRGSEDAPGYHAAEALGKIGEPAVQPLIEAIRNHFPILKYIRAGHRVRKYGPGHDGNVGLDYAELALVRIGEPAVELLIGVLGDDDRLVRITAAWALGRIKDSRAVEPLTATLKDKDKYVRMGAAVALGWIGDKRAAEPLIIVLNEDEDWHVRRDAAAALGRVRDKRAVAPLIAALENKDEPAGAIHSVRYEEDVRRNAAQSLGRIGDSNAVEPLIIALNDNDLGVRCRATYALGEIGDFRATEPLLKALSEPEKRVRRAAKRALDGIKAKYTVTQPWPQEYEYARQVDIADVLEMTLSVGKTVYKQHEPVKLTVTLTNKTDKEVKFWRPDKDERAFWLIMKYPNGSSSLDEFERTHEVFPADPIRIKARESLRCTRTLEPYYLGGHTISGRFRLRQVPDTLPGQLRAEAISFVIEQSADSEQLLKAKFDRLMSICRREYSKDARTCRWRRLVRLGPGAEKHLIAEIQASDDGEFRKLMGYALERIQRRAGKAKKNDAEVEVEEGASAVGAGGERYEAMTTEAEPIKIGPRITFDRETHDFGQVCPGTENVCEVIIPFSVVARSH